MWGAIAMAAASVLSSAMSVPPAMPGEAVNVLKQTIDHSGWNINFGDGSIETQRSQSEGEPPIVQGGSVGGLDTATVLIIGGVAILGIMVWKRRSK